MEKKYNVCYDILTILACIMVVFFHMNGIVYTFSDSISWKIAVVERCIVYSAIPIFFMLSGAKLMGYRQRYSTKEFIKKRLLRVGIPFLFWNIFYVFYEIVMSDEIPFRSIQEFISMFLNSEFQNRYWFFYPLFAVYAAIPVLSLLLQVENHRKFLWYAVYATFILRWVLVPVCKLTGIQFNSYISMPVSGGYLMYVIFGYLISTEQWGRGKRILLYILALVSGVFAVCYTITASIAAGKLQSFLFSYDYFPSALTGAAIFVFVKQLFSKPLKDSVFQRGGKVTKLIRTVSECCMGVWLTHSLGILIVAFFTDLKSADYIWLFLCPPLVFAACVAGTFIVKKIPILKHIV